MMEFCHIAETVFSDIAPVPVPAVAAVPSSVSGVSSSQESAQANDKMMSTGDREIPADMTVTSQELRRQGGRGVQTAQIARGGSPALRERRDCGSPGGCAYS